MSEKKGRYRFIIGNADISDKDGTHWWSIMDIEPKNDLLIFETLSVDGLKSLIKQDGQNVIVKILLGTEQLMRTD